MRLPQQDSNCSLKSPEFPQIMNVKSEPMEPGIDSGNDAEIMDNGDSGIKTHFSDPKPNFGLSMDEISLGITEMTPSQKLALDQTILMQNSSTLNSNMNNESSMMLMSPGMNMSGMVGTNSRVSLIDFTAEDLLQHLMSRDDVKSCEFCRIIFHDPAMYYLHKSMHDKMDVRCCNLCGKLLADKYDFTAHFLSQHR